MIFGLYVMVSFGNYSSRSFVVSIGVVEEKYICFKFLLLKSLSFGWVVVICVINFVIKLFCIVGGRRISVVLLLRMV